MNSSAAIDGLTDDHLTEPAIDGWSVRDHLAHPALWDDLRASEVTRISAGFESAWRMSGGQDAIYSDLTYKLRRSLSLVQVRWELATSHQRLIGALSAATERGLNASLYGEAALPSTRPGSPAGGVNAAPEHVLERRGSVPTTGRCLYRAITGGGGVYRS